MLHPIRQLSAVASAVCVATVCGAGLRCGAILLPARPAAAALSCTIYWTGATSGSWSDGTNWSLTDGGPAANRVPSSTDVVCMSSSPTTSIVTLNGDSTILAIEWPATVSLTPQLTIPTGDGLTAGADKTSPNSSVAQLTVDGTLIANSGFTTTGTSLSGGTIDVGGTFAVPVQTTLTLSGGSTIEIAANGILTLGDGSAINDGDNFANSVVLDAAGKVEFNGAGGTSSAHINVPFHDASVVESSAGTLFLDGGGTLASTSLGVNDSFGTTDVQSSFVASGVGAANLSGLTLVAGGVLNGPGSFSIPANGVFTAGQSGQGGGVLGDGATVTNDGTFGVTPSGIGVMSGATIENASGSTMAFSDGSFISNNDSNAANRLTNDAGATLTYAGTSGSQVASIQIPLVDNGAATVSKGTLEVDGGATIGGGASASGAGIFSLNSTTIPAAGGGSLSGMTVGPFGILNGPGAFTVPSGAVTHWANGGSLDTAASVTVDGTLDAPGAVNFHGASQVVVTKGAVLALHQGSNLEGLDTNPANHVDLKSGGRISYIGGGVTTTGAIGVHLLDAGHLSASEGTLQLQGTVTVAPTAAATGSVKVTGTLQSDPSFKVGSIAGLSTFEATLEGPGVLANPAGAHATIGNLTGLTTGAHVLNSGTLTIPTNAQVEWSKASVLENARGGKVLLNGGALQNSDASSQNILRNDVGATITCCSRGGDTPTESIAVSVDNHGVIQTSGTIELNTLRQQTTPGALTGGSYVATSSTGVLRLPVAVTSIGPGADLTVEPGGRFETPSASNALASLGLNAGVLTLDGRAALGHLVNKGTIACANSIEIESFLSKGGKLVFVLAPGKRARFIVAGTASLNGESQLVSSSAPPLGSVFIVIKAKSVSGAFSPLVGTRISATERFVPTYTTTSFFLTARPG
jgi:hypothetical protein